MDKGLGWQTMAAIEFGTADEAHPSAWLPHRRTPGHHFSMTSSSASGNRSRSGHDASWCPHRHPPSESQEAALMPEDTGEVRGANR
jgi:hypothetical protein